MGDLGLSLCLAGGKAADAGGGGGGRFCSQQKPRWAAMFGSSLAETTKPSLKGIDVNRTPTVEREEEEVEEEEEEEEGGVSSPNSTVSSVSGKRGQREESENDRAFSNGGPGTSDNEDVGDGSRKKLRLSKDQSVVLEESFKVHNTLNPKQKLALAKQLNLRPRQIEVWFQNRRARTKLKQTEVDCELLKRCCENLTEENRRLQKEVQELRALKLSPQFYMQMTPPTTLTMCPSCERVAVSSATSGVVSPPLNATTTPAQLDSGHNHRSTTAGRCTPGINRQYHQLHPQPFLQQRQVAAVPALPWSPMPLTPPPPRTAKLLDAAAASAAQRS